MLIMVALLGHHRHGLVAWERLGHGALSSVATSGDRSGTSTTVHAPMHDVAKRAHDTGGSCGKQRGGRSSEGGIRCSSCLKRSRHALRTHGHGFGRQVCGPPGSEGQSAPTKRATQPAEKPPPRRLSITSPPDRRQWDGAAGPWRLASPEFCCGAEAFGVQEHSSWRSFSIQWWVVCLVSSVCNQLTLSGGVHAGSGLDPVLVHWHDSLLDVLGRRRSRKRSWLAAGFSIAG